MQKDWSPKILLEKSSYFNRKYRHFAYYIFQNSEMLSDQGLV